MKETVERQVTNADVIVVGGGLAALAAAASVARAGRSVIVFEKSRQLGGRAATYSDGEFLFNLGPHALYRAGRGAAVLKKLGVTWSGRIPDASGALAIHAGGLHRLPAGARSLWSTTLLGFREKVQLAKVIAGFSRIDADKLQSLTVGEWLASAIRGDRVRQVIEALLRIATYANEPDRTSAGAAVAQFQLALAANVLYLDGGWKTLVDGLRGAAAEAGAQIHTGERVVSVEHDSEVRGVRLSDGRFFGAGAVILAVGPNDASELVDRGRQAALSQWAEQATPVHAACLNVALRRLPRPTQLAAFGIDTPLYLSTHSEWAKLAPTGSAAIHVMKYQGSAESRDLERDQRELEGALDLVQPGWRAELVAQRFLPNLLVSNALPLATQGGVNGRPGPAVSGVHGLFVAGDWVGKEGLLADAALASAWQAARLAVGAGELVPA